MPQIRIRDLYRERVQPIVLHFQVILQEPRSLGAIDCEVTIHLEETGFLLKGKLSGQVELACRLCAQPLPHAVALPIQEKYVLQQYTEEYSRGQEVRLESFYEEIDLESTLDLDDLVRQLVVIEVDAVFPECVEACAPD